MDDKVYKYKAVHFLTLLFNTSSPSTQKHIYSNTHLPFVHTIHPS